MRTIIGAVALLAMGCAAASENSSGLAENVSPMIIMQQGEFAMLIPDMPAAPPQTSPIVMIAQANQAQDSTKKAGRVLGVCKVVANEKERYPNSTDLSAVSEAENYLTSYENRADLTVEDAAAAKTTVLSQPKHGTLKEDSSLNGKYYYFPDFGYVGKDSAEVLAEIKGVIVKVRFFIHVLEYREKDAYDANCNEAPTNPWKISQDANGNNILTAVNSPSPFTGCTGSTDTAALASTPAPPVTTDEKSGHHAFLRG